ncbi:MAG: glyoxalase/bleomycin resistance/dioxygenase family protein [Gammaproteobacteria bacterium]|nr:MAG: glyoxalase/bleomycin resistance/dioxygenase family protein [Gammaproteobacteria bacterium]
MKIARTGIILNTEKYDECIAFYKDLFNLNILFEEVDGDFRMACFEFGGSYLMIETGGIANDIGKSVSENATKLRFNVTDIDMALEKLQACGIEAEIRRHHWGSTINIYDPDGNRVSIRDESTFVDLIKT